MILDAEIDGLTPAGQFEFLQQLLELGLITNNELMQIILYGKPLRIKLDTEYIETRLP